MMSLKKIILLLSLCFLWQVPAYAKGVPIINTGDELFEVAPFPQKLISNYPDLQDLKVGYKCSRFGLFWADVWTWDCQQVGITSAEDNSYYDLPHDILAEIKDDPNYAMKKANRSFWNNYGIIVLILLIGGYIAFSARKKD